MKIYTKTGDDGTTGLFGGRRVSKADLRIDSYGTVDELNAVIGVTRASEGISEEIAVLLEEIQRELFVLGADLATPLETRGTYEIPRVRSEDVIWLEKEIDRYDSRLPELRLFILPGGTMAASLMHVARTVARRAERIMVALSQHEAIGEHDIPFLNRLSDLFFVLARIANQEAQISDTEWDGKSRKISASNESTS